MRVASSSRAAGVEGDEASLASLAEKSKLAGKRLRRGWQADMDDPCRKEHRPRRRGPSGAAGAEGDEASFESLAEKSVLAGKRPRRGWQADMYDPCRKEI